MTLRWPLVASLAGFSALVLVACQTVPITGRSQLQLLPESEESRMGLQAYKQIRSTHLLDVTRIRQIEQWLPEALQYYQVSPYRS